MDKSDTYKKGESEFFSKQGRYKNPFLMGSREFNDYERGFFQAQKGAPASLVDEWQKLATKNNETVNAVFANPQKSSSDAYRRRKG